MWMPQYSDWHFSSHVGCFKCTSLLASDGHQHFGIEHNKIGKFHIETHCFCELAAVLSLSTAIGAHSFAALLTGQNQSWTPLFLRILAALWTLWMVRNRRGAAVSSSPSIGSMRVSRREGKPETREDIPVGPWGRGDCTILSIVCRSAHRRDALLAN